MGNIGFDAKWILFIPSFYIAIFLFLILIRTLFRDKIKNTEQLSTAGTGLIPAIVSFCIVCIIPALGFFGFLVNFPPLIVALLLGSSMYIISDFTIKFIEKKNRTFPMHIFITNASFITLAVLLLFFIYKENGLPLDILNPDTHLHADFKIYMDNQEVILYKPENIERDKYVHFHDGENQEGVIHIEGKDGVTLNDFLRTIRFNFDNCKSGFIKEGEPIYTYYVNFIPAGQSVDEYVIKDLDKLLLVCHGTATEEMLKSVSNNACIQSKKC